MLECAGATVYNRVTRLHLIDQCKQKTKNYELPEKSSISFRDQTTGKINSFLEDEFQACAQSQNLIGYLIGAILNLKE